MDENHNKVLQLIKTKEFFTVKSVSDELNLDVDIVESIFNDYNITDKVDSNNKYTEENLHLFANRLNKRPGGCNLELLLQSTNLSKLESLLVLYKQGKIHLVRSYHLNEDELTELIKLDPSLTKKDLVLLANSSKEFIDNFLLHSDVILLEEEFSEVNVKEIKSNIESIRSAIVDVSNEEIAEVLNIDKQLINKLDI